MSVQQIAQQQVTKIVLPARGRTEVNNAHQETAYNACSDDESVAKLGPWELMMGLPVHSCLR